MPVFLSHKKEDTTATIIIKNHLTNHRIECYVDVIDHKLRNTDDLTKTLMQKVADCTHLIAVVSEVTAKSWWVPFEIGVGSQLDRRITSFQLGPVLLPEFLTKWPILKKQSDLDLFVKSYYQDQVASFSEARAASGRHQTADKLHRELKAALRQ